MSMMCTVLFDCVLDVNRSKIEDLIAGYFDSFEIIDYKSSEDSLTQNITLGIGDFIFSIAVINQGYPKDELRRLQRYSYLVATEAPIVDDQHSHIIVSVLRAPGGSASSVRSAVSVTHLSAVFAQFGNITGILWNSSGVLQNPAGFNESVKNVLQALKSQSVGEESGEFLPISLWIGPRVYSPDGGRSLYGCRTFGLAEFTGYDLDLLPVISTAPEQMELLMNIAQYLIRTGSVASVGMTLDLNRTTYRLEAGSQPSLLNVVRG